MYRQSAREHGTLRFFQGLLHRNTVKADVKKAVDANLEFLDTGLKAISLPVHARPWRYPNLTVQYTFHPH